MTRRPLPDRPVTVLYVGGTGRSGSTMLANVLGEVDGFVSAGEVRFLWQRGVLQDRLCGCGEAFSECAFWTDVLHRALGPLTRGALTDLALRMHTELERRTRLRTLPTHLKRTDPRPAGASEVDDVLVRTYAAISDTARAPVVVDSSKLPTYAALLAGLGAMDVRVAHLVRDPRAAAYSWRRRKAQPDLGPDALMERRGTVASALLWVAWNRGLERLFRDRPYTRLAYEEFLLDPPRATGRLLDELDLRPAYRPEARPELGDVFVDPDVVRLTGSHTVAGNPTRHAQGLVRIVPDAEWSRRMSSVDRGAVAALTWPTLCRYGYTVRV